ncbi:sugar transporter STL1 [Plenodomus tracheiphilus IPT5]|uniref:Sugar transporter STL1 n=1 Tax=Plenodomus tracheiphilus IPT5 TaxID=1408161 RepID=A0A6A7AQM9_9PLEO|nr:sugar transporter STL1 [Plenodomus tracheiphilus IPT5]
MDKIHKLNVVHRYEKRSLLIAINCIAGLSILFFGYDQGMMGGVNTAFDYYTLMGFGHKGPDGGVVVTDTLLQGGIVSVYYLGTLVGCLIGGSIGDRYGRIKTVFIGAAVGVVGAGLQCSARSVEWMICARLINGWGTGILNSIIPVWATETAEHKSRGQFIAIEFTLNIFGVVIAYWLEYACSFYGDGTSSFIWRFPVAFQIPMLLGLMTGVFFFPESPRWLVKMGREDEARYILGRLRGNEGAEREAAESEFQDIVASCELERTNFQKQSYVHMLFGLGSGKMHTGRRVQLVVWLQIMQEWVGIAGVTIYAPTIFGIAGLGPAQRQWIAGLNNIFYMFSTLICVFTLDRIGRRWTCYWGSAGQGIAMALAGGFSYLGQQATLDDDASKASRYGIAAVSMVFVFTFIFGATWLTVPWLYPAEIFPLEVRAKGNAWGVVGWSIGNGWLTLLCPIMFEKIGEKTLYIFAACNAITIPMVWALYPETNQRSLEDINLLFASDSIWNWEAEKNFARLREEVGNVEGSARSKDVEHGASRKQSLVQGVNRHIEATKQ